MEYAILMTREEAIKCLIDAKEEFAYFHNHCVAFDMAIKALEQPEIIRCKDCEYWGEFPDYRSFCLDGAKSYDPEGFCHFARMREE